MKTKIDITRQTPRFYMQANLLPHNFRHCSDDVKYALFQSYCTNMYCCQLGFNFTTNSLIKLSTSYNSVLRLLCIPKPYSASNMFVSRGIPSFPELLRNLYLDLPLIYVSSPVCKWWSSVFYMN